MAIASETAGRFDEGKAVHHWLMKSEPDTFSIDDLANKAGQTEHWDGVRNYQARNFMRAMNVGDQAFFYHSSCAEPGIVGIVEIVRAAYPDPSALDRRSPYYDPRSSPERPRWDMVDVRLLRRLQRLIPLGEIRGNRRLAAMHLVQRGNRLSVMPVTAAQWQAILKME